MAFPLIVTWEKNSNIDEKSQLVAQMLLTSIVYFEADYLSPKRAQGGDGWVKESANRKIGLT